jgi:hypothetical protein
MNALVLVEFLAHALQAAVNVCTYVEGVPQKNILEDKRTLQIPS